MSSSRVLMTLLGTGASVFVLSGQPVHAQQSAAFAPAGNWTVNRIDPANGSASYCTLARRFSGNTVITFARNTGGEGTIAVDFQQPLFDSRQTYRIGLQAGNGMKREFMTRPATAAALVLRTGEDAAFFKALAGSTELGVLMDSNRYAFSLPDFSDGVSQLENCISGTASAPAARAGVSAAPAGNSAEIRALRAELDKLRTENDTIVSSLKAQSATRATTTNSAQNAELVARVNALETEKNQLVERLQSSQQSDVRDLTELKAALEEQKNLRSMLQSEREQRQKLEAALRQETAEAEQRGELRARIGQLESSNVELKNLRASLEAERSKRVAAEASAASSLEEQERLRARLTELETQNKSLSANAAQYQAARAELEDTTNRALQERARREATEKALKDVQISAADREAELKTLRASLEAERSKLQEAQNTRQARLTQQHEAEIARLQAQIAAQESLQTQAASEQARRQAAENTVRQMQASIAERETSIAALQKQLEEARSTSRNDAEIARLNTELKTIRDAQTAEMQTRADMVARLDAETARRTATERELQTLRTSMRNSPADSAESTRLAARLQAMEEHNNSLLNQLRDARQTTPASSAAPAANAAELQELRTMLETETARRKHVEQMLAQNGNTDDRNALMNKRLAELETRNAELQARLNATPAGSTATSAEAETLRRQLSVLQKDNEQLASRLAHLADQPLPVPTAVPAGRVVYTGNDAEMAEALAETQASLEAAVAERNEYRTLLQRERTRETPVRQAGSATEGANARIAALETERVELIRQLEFERARLEQVARGNEPAPANIKAAGNATENQLRQQLAAVEAEKASLQKQLRVTQQDVIAARSQARNTQGANAPAPSADIAELLAENRRLQQELAASSTAIASADTGALKSEIATLRAQNKLLNEEVGRRLAAAPARAEIDNANARADYAAASAHENAQRQVAAELNTARSRFEQAEAENIRLARELAQTRNQAQQPRPAPVQTAQIPAQQPQYVQQHTPQATPVSRPAVSRPVVDTPAGGGMAPVYAPAYQQPQAVPASVPVMDPYANAGPDGRLISTYLQRAGIPMVSGFEKVARVSNTDFAAFRWDTGVVFGTAEQQLSTGNALDASVQEYLQKTRNRCSGTYDQSIVQAGGVITADVACIMPDGKGAGAAMVFFHKDGMFNVVAHEGNLETFDQAMNTRDRLATFVKGQM